MRAQNDKRTRKPWSITCYTCPRAGTSASTTTTGIAQGPELQRRGKPLQQARHTHSSKDTSDGRQGKHQPNHDTGKVPRQSAIDDDENRAVRGALVEKPEADGREGNQNVEVEEERRPGGRLVLRHGRDDGDVSVAVARRRGLHKK